MTYPDSYAISTMSTIKNLLEDVCFSIFEKSSQAICAEVGDLHHACELAVHEERRFNYAFNARPKRGSRSQERLHQLRMFVGNRLIVVVNEQPIISSLLIGADRSRLKVLLKSGNDLLKRLLIDCSCRTSWIEMYFINAFGKQPGKTPSANTLCNVEYESSSLVKRKMYVVLCLLEVLLDLLVLIVIRLGLQRQKFLPSCSLNFGAALIKAERIEIGDPSLLTILP